MASADKAIKTFSARLGYQFNDPSLLRTALTHSSARVDQPSANDNDILEFLGDRVLGLVIAELLTDAYQAAETGEIARRYNRLVRKEACAEVARNLHLGEAIVMSDGEAESGGRDKLTILGDSCEAVLGAAFIDGGFENARALVRTLWKPLLEQGSDAPTDAKSALQEWAQGKGLALPRYVEANRKGPDHAPHFTSRVEIEGMESQDGEGASKRAAEQAAATAMLQREGIWKSQSND